MTDASRPHCQKRGEGEAKVGKTFLSRVSSLEEDDFLHTHFLVFFLFFFAVIWDAGMRRSEGYPIEGREDREGSCAAGRYRTQKTAGSRRRRENAFLRLP